MYRSTQTILFLILGFSCNFSEAPLDVPKLLHGQWEFVGTYIDGQFQTDTISRASRWDKDPAYRYKLYNLITDSGAFQHIYKEDTVIFFRKKHPWIKEINTESNFYTSFFYSLTPGNQFINEKLLFQDTFQIEVGEKIHLVNRYRKTHIKKLTQSELILFSKGKEWHYRKLNL